VSSLTAPAAAGIDHAFPIGSWQTLGTSSEVVNRALAEGAATGSSARGCGGRSGAARLSKLTGERAAFQDFLLSGPSFAGLDLERDPSPMRNVEL
jgi:hypothetical protein